MRRIFLCWDSPKPFHYIHHRKSEIAKHSAEIFEKVFAPATHIISAPFLGKVGVKNVLVLLLNIQSKRGGLLHFWKINFRYLAEGFVKETWQKLNDVIHLKCKGNLSIKGGDYLKNKVEQLRKERGLNQDEFAKAIRVSRQTVSSIETGKYNPSLELAFIISDFRWCI